MLISKSFIKKCVQAANWLLVPSHGYVKLVSIPLKALASNGNYYQIMIGCSVNITLLDSLKTPLATVKNLKDEMLVLNLLDLTEQLLTTRIGVKTHKGRFKFKELHVQESLVIWQKGSKVFTLHPLAYKV